MIHKYKVTDITNNRLCGYEWLNDDYNWQHSYEGYDAIYEGVIYWSGIKFRRDIFTGLTDKNGVEEIYNSDIVKMMYEGKWYYNEVLFHNGCFCLEIDGGYYPLSEYVNQIIKAGNKFVNPELLEGL